MRKILTYSSFVITSLLVILAFVTATTYTRLGIAILLYPLITFFAYKLFIVKNRKVSEIPVQLPPLKPVEKVKVEKAKFQREGVSVADIDKRAFLKLIGGAGISFFLFSLLNRRTDAFFHGKSAVPGISSLTNGDGLKINPAERYPTDGFRISEIDDRETVFYGFINTYGAWYIMKEEEDGSFRYSKGESNFAMNWDTRDNLTYDYYHRVF